MKTLIEKFHKYRKFEKEEKNNLLIDSFNRCLSKIPEDVKLIFVGDGQDKEFYKKSFKLGLNSRIKFYPEHSDEK